MWKLNDKLSYLSMVDHDTELIPLMTNEDEDTLRDEDIPGLIPILPLRNTVLFPGVVIPITVGRDKSIKLIREANKGNKIIGVTTQKDGSWRPLIGSRNLLIRVCIKLISQTSSNCQPCLKTSKSV